MALKDLEHSNGAWDWTTFATALLLIVAVVLVVFVLLPQRAPQDLSADSNPAVTSHPPSSGRS